MILPFGSLFVGCTDGLLIGLGTFYILSGSSMANHNNEKFQKLLMEDYLFLSLTNYIKHN